MSGIQKFKEEQTMLYRGFEIDNSMIPGMYTVWYCGDEVVFDSVEDAKAFIDDLVVEESK